MFAYRPYITLCIYSKKENETNLTRKHNRNKNHAMRQNHSILGPPSFWTDASCSCQAAQGRTIVCSSCGRTRGPDRQWSMHSGQTGGESRMGDARAEPVASGGFLQIDKIKTDIHEVGSWVVSKVLMQQSQTKPCGIRQHWDLNRSHSAIVCQPEWIKPNLPVAIFRDMSLTQKICKHSF